MRVLSVGNMYPPHHLGGYEVTWQSAVRYLRQRGHAVRVITTDYRRPDLPGKDAQDRDVHRDLRWYWHDHGWPRLGVGERLRLERHNARVLDRHVEEFRPDVVNWWAMGGMSMSLIERVRRAGLPAAGVVGDEWMTYGPRTDAWFRLVRGRLPVGGLIDLATGIPTAVDLDSAGSWLFNSEVVRRKALAAGWSLPHSGVARPGVDLETFRPRPEKPWRGRLIYLGRIDRRKGIDTAVRALAFLPSEVTLGVVGRGDERHLRELRALVDRLGVGARVEFGSAARRAVPDRLGQADALLFPVRWDEPWGLVPLEAMAVGTPVVATGTGGSGEYLRHEENCLIFKPPDDAEALAAAIIRLSDDEELRARLRRAGLASAARFDERSYNEAILADLERALDRRPAAAGRRPRAGASAA